jgi:hypothetical protein
MPVPLNDIEPKMSANQKSPSLKSPALNAGYAEDQDGIFPSSVYNCLECKY